MDRRFQRRRESFRCEQCQTPVEGTGYTNHCPECLWSKHVDVNPGDRAHSCQGMMEPVRIELEAAKRYVVHCCTRCGLICRNKTAEHDNFDKILELMAAAAK